MNSSIKKATEFHCPSCGAAGKPVKVVTLRALLKPEKSAEIANKAYFFCGSPMCDTVYFSEDGSRTFFKADLTVRVGVKEVSPPRPLCYCFGHSVEGIFADVERTGKSTAVDEITRRIKEEGCSCETKNPAGSCCLGTVQGYVREAFTRFGVVEGASKANGEDRECCGPGSCYK